MPLNLAQRSFGQCSSGKYLIVKPITSKPILHLKKIVAIITLIVFSCGFNLAHASRSHKMIYKSIGKFGEVKYSQFEPDAGTKFAIIVMRSDGIQSQPGLLAADTTENVSQSTGYGSSKNQNSTATASSSRSVSESTTDSQCHKLRNNLASLNGGGEIYESQANGERRFLNPIEVALKLEDTQKLLVQYCKVN